MSRSALLICILLAILPVAGYWFFFEKLLDRYPRQTRPMSLQSPPLRRELPVIVILIPPRTTWTESEQYLCQIRRNKGLIIVTIDP
jgi:hypothetical protein